MSAGASRVDSACRIGLALLGLTLLALAVWNGEIAKDGYVNHDASNALYVGRKVLHGDRLYVDWMYFVMPPVVFLSAGACFVAELLGLAPQTVLHVLVIATAGLGVWILRDSRIAGLGAGPAFTLAYLAVLVHAGSTPEQWAQREHFFALLFVPYLVWRVSGRPASRVLLVLCFGLGFMAMVKPHFVLAILASEAFFLWERRSKLAVWGSLCAGAITPLALLALQPEALRAFFDAVIPYHLSASYDRYDVPAAVFVRYFEHFILLALGAGLLLVSALALAKGLIGRRAAAVPLVLALGFYLSIWHQRKFFPYHYLPFQATSFVFLVGLAHPLALRVPSLAGRTLTRAAVVALPLLLIVHGLLELERLATSWRPAIIRSVVDALDGRGLVMWMTPSIEGPLFTHALRNDVEIMGPWTSNYTVPGMLAIEDPRERERAIREYFAPLARRIGEQRPDLVVFAPFDQAMPGITMHDVFVRAYRLFPTPGYRRLGRTREGYVLYAPRP